MRGRVTLLLFSSLLFTTAALPQCDYRLEYSAAVRATYFDLALDGNDLWAATGYGVQLLDPAVDPPRLVAYLAVPGTTRSIDVRSGVAYAGSGNAVYIIRRNGDALEMVSGNDVAGSVNDVLATNGALFVATASGLLAFDRRDPLNLATPAVLPTSSASVLSLARNGENEVLAADGDRSVERFAVSSASVTPAGAWTALDRSLSVAAAGQRIFVSDGQRTQLFTPTGTSAGIAPVGATTATGMPDDIFLIAGTDRRFRAVDLRLPEQPVELFAADILPSGGTVNRIGALARRGNRLYVAGGDAGLLTLDTAGFGAPYALRRQTFDPLGSLVDAGSAVYAGKTFGGLVELTRFSSGVLATASAWGESTHAIRDFRSDILLTSDGSTLTFWSPKPTPTALRSVPLASAVRAAVLEGNGAALALLEDGTLWRVNVQGAASAISVPPAAFLGRSDRGIALAALNENGTTEIRFHVNGDFAASPATAAVSGAATAMGVSGWKVAVFTFRGITAADFSSGTPTVAELPESNTAAVRDLAMAGNALLDITPLQLRVWNLDDRRVVRTFALSAEPLALSLHPSAPTATILHGDGVTTIDYQSATRQPSQVSLTAGNRYPRKGVAGADRLFVFDGQTIEVYNTAFSSAPRFATSISVPGAVDLAASPSMLFVLFGNGAVTAYTHFGTPLRSATIDEGADMVPQNINTAGGAPWVSILRGCVTTGCEKKTIVLDPGSLVRTASLEGGIDDLAVSGTFANALADILTSVELRTYTIANPLHPVPVASRPAEGSPAAVASDGSSVYTMGAQLFAYSQPSLAKTGELLPGPATDLAVDAGCALVTGRTLSAELFTRANWMPAGHLSLPGSARGIITQGGKVIILTDYSIEIWSRVAPMPPSRRRAAS
ncbi:MAG TPA: hypothetical protein VM779_03105 [Thermoanaerobaculia bacterium]|nr:hypothetical protein [Thermoanaerobaculia bacterium]